MAAADPIPGSPILRLPDLESERGFRIAFFSLFAALLALAWHNRFVQDDAFIAFRYADHLARGQGLVFNLGERVEGYTCFLYVLLIAAAMKLGVPPVAGSYVIGIASCAVSLAMTCRLGTLLSGRCAVGLLAMLLLDANYSFRAYATGGLETQLETALVVSFLALGAEVMLGRAHGRRRLAALSTIAALAVMARPDAALLVAPMGVALVAASTREQESARGRHLVALIGPAAALLGGWLAWKLAYYGDVLPNTYYAKLGSPPARVLGVYYIVLFFTSYWLAPIVLIGLWKARDLLAPARVGVPLFVALGLWLLYILAVGGDFMEFRLMVPALPIVAWLIASTAMILERQARLGAAVVMVALIGSLHHAITYNNISHPDFVESVWKLKTHLTREDQDWINVGRVLGRELEYSPEVVIATTAAGAIPFYSRLSCVDMYGLTDAWIARHGEVWGDRAGHRKHPTLDYLLQRHVNLLISHPLLILEKPESPIYLDELKLPHWVAGDARGLKAPTGLMVLEIPVSREYRLIALYLTPSARVDAAIRRYGWRVCPVVVRPLV